MRIGVLVAAAAWAWGCGQLLGVGDYHADDATAATTGPVVASVTGAGGQPGAGGAGGHGVGGAGLGGNPAVAVGSPAATVATVSSTVASSSSSGPPPPAFRYAFVSSVAVSGAFVDGDGICQKLGSKLNANAAWYGWFSAAKHPASCAAGPEYRLVDNVTVVGTCADLLTTGPQHPIHLDETGADVATYLYVWTGTAANGMPSPFGNCMDWSSVQADTGGVGYAKLTGPQWTSVAAFACAMPARLYCFEK